MVKRLLYKDVNLEKVNSGLRQLRQGGHTPGWLVIDDGWQQVEGQLLSAIEPNSHKFLPCLKANVAQIKAEFNLTVGVWHAFLGYWGGLQP